jgi:hypothetical protein
VPHHIGMSLEKVTRKFLKEANKKILDGGILSKGVRFNIPKYVERFFKETKENIHTIKFELNIPLSYEVFVIDGFCDKDGKDMWPDFIVLGSEFFGNNNIPEKPTLEITFVFDALKVSSYALFEVLKYYKDVFEVDFAEQEKFVYVTYKVEDFEFPFVNGNYL